MPGFHYITAIIIAAVLVLSVISFFHVLPPHDSFIRGGVIPVLLSVALILLYWYSRSFSTTVQDRAIRAEESLRHFILSGKPFDGRLSMSQIVALRFASDEEYLALAQRAATESLTPKEIKKAIKKWRPDNDRC